MDIFNNKYDELFKKYNIPKLNVEIAYYDNVFEHRDVNTINTIAIRRDPEKYQEIIIT
jgi:hypothetical protein